MPRADSLEKTLMLRKIEGKRRRRWQRMRWLDGIPDSVEVSLSKLQRWWRTDKEAWHTAVHGVKNSWTRLSNWTTADQNLLLEGSSTGLCFYLLGYLREGGQEGLWLSQSLQALITKDPRYRWRTSSVLQAPREQPQSKESSYQHLQKTRPDTVSKQLICVPGRSFKNILCSLLPLLV